MQRWHRRGHAAHGEVGCSVGCIEAWFALDGSSNVVEVEGADVKTAKELRTGRATARQDGEVTKGMGK